VTVTHQPHFRLILAAVPLLRHAAAPLAAAPLSHY
jgi:hypothetical protein